MDDGNISTYLSALSPLSALRFSGHSYDDIGWSVVGGWLSVWCDICVCLASRSGYGFVYYLRVVVVNLVKTPLAFLHLSLALSLKK